MARRNFGAGALRVLGPTTSTGTWSDPASTPPVQLVTAQVTSESTGATGTFTVQGCLDGSNWSTVISATTFADGITVTSTAGDLYTNLRAQFTVTGTTVETSIYLAGK